MVQYIIAFVIGWTIAEITIKLINKKPKIKYKFHSISTYGDLEYLELLTENFIKDKKNVYKKLNIIKPRSIKMTGMDNEGKTYTYRQRPYASDKNIYVMAISYQDGE